MATETATILVTDLVGSTDLRMRLGEDRAEAARRAHDRTLSEVAERSGGTVVKGLGDGLLVRFPGAAEAVGAAVAMQQGIESLGRREQLDLAIRVGLSAGDVTLEDGDCFGTPVIEAARLCDAADGGQILAAEVVTVLARGRGGHEVVDQGALTLKGLPDPVIVRQVVWTPARSVADLRAQAPYVGREVQRAQLLERFEAAAAGRGGLCLVTGEPGIGKSRLVAEVCADVTGQHGALVLWGGCHDGDVGAYAAFVEAFSDWVARRPTDEIAGILDAQAGVLARLVPAVRAVLADVVEPAVVSADEATVRLHRAVLEVMDRLAGDAPVALVLDDVHWADEATVGLLRAVARGAIDRRLLVIATYRDTDLDRRHPLAEALPLLRREVEPVRIALDGLPAAAVRELLERLAGHDVPDVFADLLATQSEGNPFFLREMLLHLVDEGALAYEDGTWVAADAIDTVIPEGVREVVGRRLSGLSPATDRLLGVGALFDVAFPLTVAAEVADLSEEEALDAVDEALEAQVVRPTDTFDHYAFVHALFRQTLIEELNPSRQVRLHRAVAESYEKLLAGDPAPAQAAVLARHWHLSAALPGADRGVASAMIVARDAIDRYAYREAFDALGVVLELLPDGDEREAEVRRERVVVGLHARVDRAHTVADAEVLGRLVDADRGADAAADAIAELVRETSLAGEIESGWALAAVARQWLDPARRDSTWAVIRFTELSESDFRDPDHPGIPLDTPRTGGAPVGHGRARPRRVRLAADLAVHPGGGARGGRSRWSGRSPAAHGDVGQRRLSSPRRGQRGLG